MPGDKKEETPSPPAQPDIQAVLDELKAERADAATFRAESLAREEASLAREEKLSKKFEGLLHDSNSKYHVLQKELDTLREQTEAKEEATPALTFLDHVPEDNPFPRRPRNTGLKPDHFNLYGNQTADLLEAKPHSSLKYEYRTLSSALSYFYDAKRAYDEERNASEFGELSAEQQQIFDAIFNTLDGVFEMFSKRYSVIKIRARAESEPGGLSEHNQLLLNYLETKLHGVFPGETLVDSEMEGWLQEYKEKTAAAELKQATSKAAASHRKEGSRSTASEEKSGVKTRSQLAQSRKEAERRKPSAHQKKG